MQLSLKISHALITMLASACATQAPDLPPITLGGTSPIVAPTTTVVPASVEKTADRQPIPSFNQSATVERPDLVSTIPDTQDSIMQYGRIIDVQILNQSTPGHAAGSYYGSLAGQTAYIDSTNWQNYSASKQVGFGILGAILGSAMNQPAKIRIHQKFYVKNNVGEVIERDVIKSDHFHPPKGVCISIESLKIASEKHCLN